MNVDSSNEQCEYALLIIEQVSTLTQLSHNVCINIANFGGEDKWPFKNAVNPWNKSSTRFGTFMLNDIPEIKFGKKITKKTVQRSSPFTAKRFCILVSGNSLICAWVCMCLTSLLCACMCVCERRGLSSPFEMNQFPGSDYILQI